MRTLADYRPQHDEDCDSQLFHRLRSAVKKPCTCGLDALIEAVRQSDRSPRPETECEWVYAQDDGVWRSYCGMYWNFDDGEPPASHDVHYCGKCGKKLIVKPSTAALRPPPPREQEHDHGAELIGQIASPLAETEPRLNKWIEALMGTADGLDEGTRKDLDHAGAAIASFLAEYPALKTPLLTNVNMYRDLCARIAAQIGRRVAQSRIDQVGNAPVSASSGIAGTMSSAQKSSSPSVEAPQPETVEQADQAICDAAWALNDPDPNGRQWRRSKALKDAIDAFEAAVRHSGDPEKTNEDHARSGQSGNIERLPNAAATVPDSMPKVGDTIRYDFLGAIWTDDVIAVDGDLFWTKNHGKAIHRRALVVRP